MKASVQRRRGALLITAEAVRNVRAWAALTGSLIVLSAVLGAVLSWSTATTADRSARQIADLDDGGRQVLRIVPSAARLPAAFCDRLRALPSVSAAYGIGSLGRARLSTRSAVTTLAATAGVYDYFGVAVSAKRGATVLAGATVTERNGFVDGGWTRFDSTGPSRSGSHHVTTRTLEQTPRTGDVDDVIIVDLALSASAVECRVEPVDGAREALAASLAALAPRDSAVRVVSLRPDIELADEPDRRLASLPGNLATLAVGGSMSLALAAWWFVRRAEWALYRAFGMTSLGLGALALVEWLLVCGLPMAAGGAWGLAATPAGSVDTAYMLAASNLAVAIAITLTTVGAWSMYLRVFSPSLALRGM